MGRERATLRMALPFLPLFTIGLAGGHGGPLDSSGVAGFGNLTFWVMGGNSGKIWQEDVAALGKKVAAGATRMVDGTGVEGGRLEMAGATQREARYAQTAEVEARIY